MITRPRHLVPLLLVCALSACCHTPKEGLGDPEEPYPVRSPQAGQIVHLATGTKVSSEQMYDIAADQRVVYIGETHDNPASHRLELELLRGLTKRHPGRQALGMEMFSRSQQPVLDRWVAGELEEKEFLKQVRWYETWKSDFAYYREILEFCRDNEIPVIALNAEKKLVSALTEAPPERLTPEQQKELPELDFTDPYQRAMVAAIFGDHIQGDFQIEGFVRAQTLWDETMADSAYRYLSSPGGRQKHLLVMGGSYHIGYGFGIPRRVFRRLPASYCLIGGEEVDLPADTQGRVMNVDLPEFPMRPYDFLAYLHYEELPNAGVRLGVGFEPAPSGPGLLVTAVEPGSSAQAAGIAKGDLLLEFDGEPLAESFDLIYAVKQKFPGENGSVKLKRDGKTLELEVTFHQPAKGPVQPGK
jgi:uncharacterized iron-regulated protein